MNDLPPKVRLSSKASKRSRGEIACAECRRLKIRCDRNIPCSTCVKRGCASLCPNGTIPPGEGSRFVLAATDHLQGKMEKLESRMRSLEDALAIAHASSNAITIHPLLSGPEDGSEQAESSSKPTPPPPSETSSANLSDALGTLYIDKHGASRFFGPSGGSESLLLKSKHAQNSTLSLPELDPSYLPSDINHCYQCFPFTPSDRPVASVQQSIETFLPPVERTIELCDTFLEHLSWMFHIVSRQEMMAGFIPSIYKQNNLPYGPHDLALVLVVIGIGALVDLDQQPYNLEAQHYYRLARAAGALQSVLTEPSVVTIKMLHLMSIYNGLSGKESNLEQSYALLNLAGQVAVRIGFHVDPSLWGFEGKEAYDRRVYFWYLLQGSLWQSLVTGRPPAILSAYIDCQIPTPEDEIIFQQGEVPTGFGTWGFKATADCLLHVVRATLSAKPPSYESVLELDHKIRSFTPSIEPVAQDERTAVSMRAFVRSHYQDLMLLFLHRAFFAQAMAESPADPLSSPYGASVTAAYKSACVVLEDTRLQYMKKPGLCGRIWRIWSLAFSAAIVVGTVAIQGRHMNLIPPALEQFESACDVFRSVAQLSSRAARALPILDAMLQKALHPEWNSHQYTTTTDKSDGDDISIFGGRPTLLNTSDSGTSTKPPQSLDPPHVGDPALDPFALRSASVPQVPQRPVLLAGQYTFAELSQGWDGLFHETPLLQTGGSNTQTIGQTYQGANPWGGTMPLDDRWSSFMHNYSILNDPRL